MIKNIAASFALALLLAGIAGANNTSTTGTHKPNSQMSCTHCSPAMAAKCKAAMTAKSAVKGHKVTAKQTCSKGCSAAKDSACTASSCPAGSSCPACKGA